MFVGNLNNLKQGDIMSIRVKIVTEEEWLRNVQRMSRKELLNLCIEQHKQNYRLSHAQTYLLRDLAYARRKIGEQWVPSFIKNRVDNI